MIGFLLLLILGRIVKGHPDCSYLSGHHVECCQGNDSFETCCDGYEEDACKGYCSGVLPDGSPSHGLTDPHCHGLARCRRGIGNYADCCATWSNDCNGFCWGPPGSSTPECSICHSTRNYGACCGGSFNPTDPSCDLFCETFPSLDTGLPCLGAGLSRFPNSTCGAGGSGSFSLCCPGGDLGVRSCGGIPRLINKYGYCSVVSGSSNPGDGIGGFSVTDNEFIDNDCKLLVCATANADLGASFAHCCDTGNSSATCVSFCEVSDDVDCFDLNCGDPTSSTCKQCANPKNENCNTCAIKQSFAQCCVRSVTDCGAFQITHPVDFACRYGGTFGDCCNTTDLSKLSCGGDPSRSGPYNLDDFRYGFCSIQRSGGVPSASGTPFGDPDCQLLVCASKNKAYGANYDACCADPVSEPVPCTSFCDITGDAKCVDLYCGADPTATDCLKICASTTNTACNNCRIRQTYAECCLPDLTSTDCSDWKSNHTAISDCGGGTGGSYSDCCDTNDLNVPSCGGDLTPAMYHRGGFCSIGGFGGFDAASGDFGDPDCASLICGTTNGLLWASFDVCCNDTNSPTCTSYCDISVDSLCPGTGLGCSTLGEVECKADGDCSWSADTYCTDKSAESSPEKPFPWFIIVIVVVVVVLVVALVVTLIVLKKNKKACFKQDEGEGEGKQKELPTVENANTAVADADAESSGAKAHAPADGPVVGVDDGAPIVDVEADPPADGNALAPDANTVGSANVKSKPIPKTKSKTTPKAKSKARPKAKVDADAPAGGPADSGVVAPDTNTVKSANVKSKASPKAKSKAKPKAKPKASPKK